MLIPGIFQYQVCTVEDRQTPNRKALKGANNLKKRSNKATRLLT